MSVEFTYHGGASDTLASFFQSVAPSAVGSVTCTRASSHATNLGGRNGQVGACGLCLWASAPTSADAAPR